MNSVVKYAIIGGVIYVGGKAIMEGSQMLAIKKQVRTEIVKTKWTWKGGLLGSLWITLQVKAINPTTGTMDISHPNVYLHTYSKDKKASDHLDPNYQLLVSELINENYEIPANGEVYFKLINIKVGLLALPKILKNAVNTKSVVDMFKTGDLDNFLKIVKPGLWITSDFRANGIAVSMPNQLT